MLIFKGVASISVILGNGQIREKVIGTLLIVGFYTEPLRMKSCLLQVIQTL